MKVKRNIIRIDEDKCNGCGLCVPACEEGALQIIDGKARLVKEIYCDGLGNCLGECPQGAITIEEREADPFDEEAVAENLRQQKREAPAPPAATGGCSGGCPGSAIMDLLRGEDKGGGKTSPGGAKNQGIPDSELSQWPVQLHLINPDAPYWEGADLLISADCVPVAYAGYHSDLLAGRRVIIACPKLDDTSSYVGKLAALFHRNTIKSVTVAHMEVPCCGGLGRIVQAAAEAAGLDVEIDDVCIGVGGQRV
jgi:ferredoxin